MPDRHQVRVKDMTLNTKGHKRLTCPGFDLLAATESECITLHFGIYMETIFSKTVEPRKQVLNLQTKC